MSCGLTRDGRAVGLQIVGRPRGEAALLAAAALFEQLLGLDRLLPIGPRPQHRAARNNSFLRRQRRQTP